MSLKRSRKSGDFEITPFHSTNTLENSTNDWEISFLNCYQITEDTSDDIRQSNGDLEDNKPRKKKKLIQETDNGELTDNYGIDDNSRVILIKPGDLQYFYGMCRLTVLHGTVEILGYPVDKNTQPSVNIYSFRGHSLLYLKNLTKTTNKKTHISKIGNRKLPKPIIIKDNTAVVLCERLQATNIDFIIKHISQQILPQQQQQQRIIFGPQGDWNLLKFDSECNNLVDELLTRKTIKMMLCGGKSTGKSTFLRYIINCLLIKYDKIQIIDLDPGQSEFTVPGCVSIITLTTPIFGINFTHLTRTEKSLLTQINIAHEPAHYLNTIQHLLQYKFDDNLPILVNTMGYTHDIGINLLSSLICLLKPTNIVQINSGNYKKNFRERLELDVVQKNAELLLKNVELVDFSYNLHNITSMTDNNVGWRFESRQIREMTILSYFGTIVDKDSNSIYSEKVPLYQIDLRNVKITDLNGNQLHPAVINANIVALCSKETNPIDNEQIFFRCYGWGIVRGIDLETNNLVLLTPENRQVLQNVNYLVSNGLTLPPSIYMTPDDIEGDMPYVNSGNLLYLGQLTKRSTVPFSRF